MKIEMKDEDVTVLIQFLTARLGEQQKEIEALKALPEKIGKDIAKYVGKRQRDICDALQGTTAVTDFHSGDVVTDGEIMYLLKSPIDEEGGWNTSAFLNFSFDPSGNLNEDGWVDYYIDMGEMDIDVSCGSICKVSSNELALFDYKLKEKGYKRNGGNVVKI